VEELGRERSQTLERSTEATENVNSEDNINAQLIKEIERLERLLENKRANEV